MRLWFAPACLRIPARDNSIVSRSGRRRYRIRKLVWSCRNHSRNSFICSYHAVLQCGFPNAALPLRPGQGEGCQRGSRDSGTAAPARNRPGSPPCTDDHVWLPEGPHKSTEGREEVLGETWVFVAAFCSAGCCREAGASLSLASSAAYRCCTWPRCKLQRKGIRLPVSLYREHRGHQEERLGIGHLSLESTHRPGGAHAASALLQTAFLCSCYLLGREL